MMDRRGYLLAIVCVWYVSLCFYKEGMVPLKTRAGY